MESTPPGKHSHTNMVRCRKKNSWKPTRQKPNNYKTKRMCLALGKILYEGSWCKGLQSYWLLILHSFLCGPHFVGSVLVSSDIYYTDKDGVTAQTLCCNDGLSAKSCVSDIPEQHAVFSLCCILWTLGRSSHRHVSCFDCVSLLLQILRK